MKHDCSHPQLKIYTHIYIHKHVVATATSEARTTESTETVSSTGSAGTTEPSTTVETTSVESTSEGTFIYKMLNNNCLLMLLLMFTFALFNYKDSQRRSHCNDMILLY